MKIRADLAVILSFLCLAGYTPAKAELSDDKDEFMREVRLSEEMRDVRDTHVNDTRIAEFQAGKDMIDLQGRRVRMEQYILRPEPNQFKHMVFNHREGRIDQGTVLKTFNRDLPEKLAEASPWDDKTAFTSNPDFYVKSEEVTLSNGIDSFDAAKSNGQIYQEAINSYKLLYDKEQILVNDKTKIRMMREGQDPGLNLRGIETWWVPNKNGVLTKTASSNGMIYDLETLLNTGTEKKIYSPDWKDTNTWTFADNTFLSIDQTWINDEGKILPRDIVLTLTQDNYKQEISKWNIDNNVKATEFNGRDIDVVASPNIFIEAIENNISPAPGF